MENTLPCCPNLRGRALPCTVLILPTWTLGPCVSPLKGTGERRAIKRLRSLVVNVTCHAVERRRSLQDEYVTTSRFSNCIEVSGILDSSTRNRGNILNQDDSQGSYRPESHECEGCAPRQNAVFAASSILEQRDL